jgi:hypothetical protein
VAGVGQTRGVEAGWRREARRRSWGFGGEEDRARASRDRG